eukprot:COSAG03_NODE_118_length_12325_cov_11.481515_11_plen_91_part_00
MVQTRDDDFKAQLCDALEVFVALADQCETQGADRDMVAATDLVGATRIEQRALSIATGQKLRRHTHHAREVNHKRQLIMQLMALVASLTC